MALSIGFRIFSLLPSCYSSYGALNFYPGGTFAHCSCQPSLDAHFTGRIQWRLRFVHGETKQEPRTLPVFSLGDLGDILSLWDTPRSAPPSAFHFPSRRWSSHCTTSRRWSVRVSRNADRYMCSKVPGVVSLPSSGAETAAKAGSNGRMNYLSSTSRTQTNTPQLSWRVPMRTTSGH